MEPNFMVCSSGSRCQHSWGFCVCPSHAGSFTARAGSVFVGVRCVFVFKTKLETAPKKFYRGPWGERPPEWLRAFLAWAGLFERQCWPRLTFPKKCICLLRDLPRCLLTVHALQLTLRAARAWKVCFCGGYCYLCLCHFWAPLSPKNLSTAFPSNIFVLLLPCSSVSPASNLLCFPKL